MRQVKSMVTQKTIAKKLGISPSLVSRALTGTAANIGASEETVRKIRAAARELGYAPNAAALTLRGAKSKTIGVVIKDFDDPFLGRMTGAIQEQARKNGCSLILTGFDLNKNKPRDISSLLRFQLDALIICGSDISTAWVEEFTSREIPIAQIGSDSDYPGVSRVEVDETTGIKLLVDYLYRLGHHEIGFIGGNTGPHLRRRNILAASLKNQNSVFSIAPEGENTGLRAMEKLLNKVRKKLPTVIMAADDITAQGGLRALHNAGLTVPGDISLTGFDDIPAAGLMIPALTTIRVPVIQMVDAAFDLIFKHRYENVIHLKPELVERESCSNRKLK